MLLWISLLSCTGTTETESSLPEDLLLVVLDTFRADQVTSGRAPAIHRHALESWWPESSWAPSPWTVPSLSALLTGRPPWTLTSVDDHGLPEDALSLPERLPSHTSAMFSTNPYVTESRGFAQGFSHFESVKDDKEAVQASQAWWREQVDRPKLMVVVLMSTHLPYEPSIPPEDTSPQVGEQFWDLDNWSSYTDPADQAQIRRLYTSQVPDLDRYVAEILGLAGPKTVIAVVSDHGEELFEHGGFEHGHAFWEEVTRVHAAIRFPDAEPSRPEGLWTLQDVGQMLAFRLRAADQASPPSPQTEIIHGYPLSYRDPVLHTWGIRTETEAYFDGLRPYQTLGGANLVTRLKSYIDQLRPSGSTQIFQSSAEESAALEALGYQTKQEVRPPESLKNEVDFPGTDKRTP